MENKLLEQSRLFKATADALLAETKLVETLAAFGTVHFTGSYYADLMLAPDIDLHVAIPNLTKKTAITILTSLIQADAFRSYQFYDYISRPYEGWPEGYYVGLKAAVEVWKWKVDVWLFDNTVVKEQERFRHQQEVMEAVRTASEATREHILELKEKKNKGELKLTSFEIYQQVLAGKL